MYLKTLTIKGFKSFADTVDLHLEQGVTVVVGPNGSGKSNVVDAIAWVLGAQAPSSVRSQKMDDVIFAGTDKRAALGRAEVSLTIDNSDGQLPTEFSEVKITRTLFRTGDSDYSLNGVPCRLLDIEELLSDSGVGRTQHVIVSQGQIDAVLNARPEDRRLIIEEAAGVLKFRKRREKAQRRLLATEANLTRIQDSQREVRRQLRPLEKQADAARRHGAVVAELRTCQVWLVGRQLHILGKRMSSHATDRQGLVDTDQQQRSRLAELDTEVMSIEAELSAQGAVDLGDALARLEGLSQRAVGADDLLAERLRGLARERQATIDGDVVATLRSEASELTEQLIGVDSAVEALEPAIDQLSRSEASLADDRASFEIAVARLDHADTDAESEAAAAGRAAEVRGELAALSTSITGATNELGGISERLQSLDERKTTLAEQSEVERAKLGAAIEREQALVIAADGASAGHAEAQSRLLGLRDDRAEADAVCRSAEARCTALTEALAATRTEAGLDELGNVAGIVGTILDVVEIEHGWEVAVEAALGGTLTAVLVDTDQQAREALESLERGQGHGSVIALQGLAAAEPGSAPRPRSILKHMSSTRPDVMALLTQLLGEVDVTDGDWRTAVDASQAAGGRTIISKSGDRIGNGLWRIGNGGAGATQAALDQGLLAVEETSAHRDECDLMVAVAETDVAQLAEHDQQATSELDRNDADLTSTTEALHQYDARTRQIEVEQEALSTQRIELEERLRRETVRAGELGDLLPGLESAELESAERTREHESTRNILAERTAALTDQRTEVEVRRAALQERRGVLRRRLGEVEDRLGRLTSEHSVAEHRGVLIDRTTNLTSHLRSLLSDTVRQLQTHLDQRREERTEQSATVRKLTERLDTVRLERGEAETELRELAERRSRVEIDEAETRLRLETTTEMLRRDLEIEPQVAVAVAQPELPEGTTPAARARELERDLKLMGPINPLAAQEFDALQERHDFLNLQIEDIRSSRRELNKVIRAIDEEIVTVFASAFADVADNFETLFDRLFPGGQGRLKLTEPSNLLETGIEVSAKPSGKNVKKLSLLSGGERSLTALAFLFAVFRSRPSPFYIMDEVEAALDDVNLHRFLGLIDEFRSEAQLVIVSHQKRTMESADTLYGVTMEPGGSSVLISERSEVEGRFGSVANDTRDMTPLRVD